MKKLTYVCSISILIAFIILYIQLTIVGIEIWKGNLAKDTIEKYRALNIEASTSFQCESQISYCPFKFSSPFAQRMFNFPMFFIAFAF